MKWISHHSESFKLKISDLRSVSSHTLVNKHHGKSSFHSQTAFSVYISSVSIQLFSSSFQIHWSFESDVMNSSHSRWVWAGEMCLCIWSALLPALIISAAGWPFDVVICKMSGLVQGASVSASVFTLVAIAVERLITLTRPHFTQDYKHNLQEETLSYTDTICTSAVHAKPAHLKLLGTISCHI